MTDDRMRVFGLSGGRSASAGRPPGPGPPSAAARVPAAGLGDVC